MSIVNTLAYYACCSTTYN